MNNLQRRMACSRISIFSLQAGGNIGHGKVYLLNICKRVAKIESLFVYTFPDESLSSELAEIENVRHHYPANGLVNSVKKSNYNKYGLLKFPFYGFARARSYYNMISEFYKDAPKSEYYHLLDFEYLSSVIFLLFRPRFLERTLFGFHSSDFEWIKGRPLTVNLYKRLLRLPLRRMVIKSKGITTHGEYLKKRIIQNLRLQGYEHKVKSIPYGSDFKSLDGLDRQTIKTKFGLNAERILLLFGVLRSDKGIKEVINKFAEVDQEIHLLIVGADGDVRGEQVETWVKESNVSNRVSLINRYVTDQEMEEVFAISDYLLIPYKAHHIAFSGPLSLAVQYSRPVIASDIGEIGLFVNKYNIGQLFKCEDWASFVKATSRAFKSNQLKNFQFEQCHLENSWDYMAEQIIQLYNE